MKIKDKLKVNKYNWNPSKENISDSSEGSWQKIVPLKSYKFSDIKEESWAKENLDGIVVEVVNDKEQIL